MVGAEIPIEWQGRPAMAWLPDPLTARDLSTATTVARLTERAAAAVRRSGDRHLPGWEPLARLLVRAEGIASSQIEGLRVPVTDVAAAEFAPYGGVGTAAWVADNLAVVSEGLRSARSSPLTVAALHEWHRRLMRHGDLDPDLIGRFRDRQGWVGGRRPRDAAYVPSPAAHVPPLVADLVGFVNRSELDAVTQAAVAHAQFEVIHPYGDGNGRIGRVLMLWILARRVGVAVPPPVSAFIARDPGGYLSGLHRFRTGDVDAWVGWFADVVCRAGDAVTEWADDLEAILGDWHARLTDLRSDAAAHAVVDLLPAHPVISARTAASGTGVSERAARDALDVLAGRGILEAYEAPGRGRGRPARLWLARTLLDLVRGWAG